MKKGKWATGQIQLSVRGKPLEIRVKIPAKPVKPQRMLPVFQKMTNLFVEIGVEEAKSEGKEISCKKGCGACCRQPVPLPEFEAYNIAEMVEKMPEPRRREVKERFNKALTHFTEIGWVERFAHCADYSKEERQEMFWDYFREGIPCPFLVDDSCSIHQDRPLVCREYLVTNPAENCLNPTAETINMVEIPVAPSKKIFKLGQKKPLRGLNVIPLVMSLEWAVKNPKNFPKKTGGEWLAEFLQSITKSKVSVDSKTG
ncbi:hypothetical protein BH20ACI1_BH20ACI1_08580 [soil metagenome]